MLFLKLVKFGVLKTYIFIKQPKIFIYEKNYIIAFNVLLFLLGQCSGGIDGGV